jgi:hypothetical protein
MDNHYPPWNNKRKIKARTTIITICKTLLGYDCIPFDKQYITVCGKCTDANGNFLNECEPDQLIKDGFIRPEQYVGIDVNRQYIQDNYNARKDLKWICSDFNEAINEMVCKDEYRAEIINFDWVQMPDEGTKALSTLLALISGTNTKIVIANFMLNNPHSKLEVESDRVVNELVNNDLYLYAARKDKWTYYPEAYLYSINMKTLMETIILHKL